MCSSWVFVVQSTIVTASIVRGSAPRPITTSLVRARSWARAAPAPASPRATARASRTFRRRIEPPWVSRSEEHTSELQSHSDLVCRLLLEKKKNKEQEVQHHRYT